MKITLDLTPDARDLLVDALDSQIADHVRQASRPGASQLARRGHLSMRDDLVSIKLQVMLTEDQAAA